MIGFIDSGVGGINVLGECAKLFNEDFVYLCDNKNCPYGNKSKKKLLKIARYNIDYLIKNFNITLCVIACNTLSIVVGKKLQQEYNIPIILTEFSENKINELKKDVLFFATKNTIKNNQIIVNKLNNNGYKSLYIKGFAKKIDNNLNKLDNLDKILKKYLLKTKYKKVKTIVLGCTHFKTIKNNIKNIMPNVEFYEYEKDVANAVRKMVKPKDVSTFNIVLTNYSYPKYVELKAYLNKVLSI